MRMGLTGADSSSMELWSILEKSRMSPRMVSSVSPLSRIVSASSLQKTHQSIKSYNLLGGGGRAMFPCVIHAGIVPIADSCTFEPAALRPAL